MSVCVCVFPTDYFSHHSARPLLQSRILNDNMSLFESDKVHYYILQTLQSRISIYYMTMVMSTVSLLVVSNGMTMILENVLCRIVYVSSNRTQKK